MNLLDLLRDFGFKTNEWGPAIILVLVFIEISPIPINPWKWIFRMVGKLINEELLSKIDLIDNKVDRLESRVDYGQASQEQSNAVTVRYRILRFCDELQQNNPHSKDSYDQVMGDITFYEQYCIAHPDFKNNQTASTVAYIQKNYEERLEKRDFL